MISGRLRSIIVVTVILPPSFAWKLVLAIVLGAAIFVSIRARAPRRPVPGGELRRLVVAALTLYAVGALASVTHHAVLAGIVYAAGISVCSLAAWLSRGTDADGPPRGTEPEDEEPPPTPDGAPRLDWATFERDFREYAERVRAGAR